MDRAQGSPAYRNTEQLGGELPGINDIGVQAKGLGYELGSEIGRGGCAVVWRAKGPMGPCAIKTLSDHRFKIDDQMVKRFRREASALLRIEHPNVVKVLDFIESKTGPDLLVMELADSTLAKVLESKKPCPVDLALLWLCEIACGLAALHAAGITHRDVTPKNVLLRANRTAMVSDLGAALVHAEETITVEKDQLGSLIYISPEQRENPHRATAASDVFSLGQVGFHLLTGLSPHGATRNLVHYAPHVNHQVAELVDEMRNYRAADRPPDAGVVLKRLKGVYAKLRSGQLPNPPKPDARALDSTILLGRQQQATESLATPVRDGVRAALRSGPFFVTPGAQDQLNQGWLATQSIAINESRAWSETWLLNGRTGEVQLIEGPEALEPSNGVAGALQTLASTATPGAFSAIGCHAAMRCCVGCGGRLAPASHDRFHGGLRIGYCPACSPQIGRCLLCGKEPQLLLNSDEWGAFSMIGCGTCDRTEDGSKALGPPHAEGRGGALRFPEIERGLAEQNRQK